MVNIYLFTHSFPYTKNSETFLETEMHVISSYSEYNVTVIPLLKSKFKRELPLNVVLDNKICEYSFFHRALIFFRLLLSPIFWSFSKERTNFEFKVLFDWVKYFYGASLIKQYIYQNRNNINPDDIFYSYWFSFAPLGFALAKNYNWFKTNRCFTRAHGFDVYLADRGVYVPLREFTLNRLEKVFVVSDYGCSFLQDKYPQFNHKVTVSRLGVMALSKSKLFKVNSLIKNEFNVVSCSGLSFIKRVPLIFKSINNYCELNCNIKITWVHIGDGEEKYILKELISQQKKNNLFVKLTGSITNEDVKEIYSKNKFHAFINLSTTEGVPVSIMEAISAGIPILATDVGGNREIVTEETGLLLSNGFKQEAFNEKLDFLLINNIAYVRTVTSFFEKNYSAANNYPAFYENMTKQKM
ncbi:MAG: glycosyltransferase [Bacteroidales bacterium]|nr:MAG: glycosyltransferase [Bacteroidales bacterium]